MSDNIEFSINENTFVKLLSRKKEMGFGEKGWDEWFEHVFSSNSIENSTQEAIEKFMAKFHFDKYFDDWVENFTLNLDNIWNESSARILDPTIDQNYKKEEHSAIVIGRGPSIKKHKHLELLANSDYKGSIVCSDGALKNVLEIGITPDKFPKFYVITIDTHDDISKHYDYPIIDKYGSKINCIVSTVVNPLTVARARQTGIKIHWFHSLFDYGEGKKSFNYISALMVRTKNHLRGLPALQTGGNVGTSGWFVSWQILKCSTVGLIGINHGWNEDDSWETIISHGNQLPLPKDIDKNSSTFKKLFLKIYNPDFDCNCVVDPTFQYYSNALKEFISRSPSWLTTINATEGGSIFGKRITCMTFKEFLQKYEY